MLNIEPSSVIRTILINQLNLPSDRIWIYNANTPIPKDDNLFIVIKINARIPYANNSKYIDSENTLKEFQYMNVQEDLTISLLSKNIEARTRAYEVQMALGSIFSQQKQEENKIHIARLGRVVDASFLEATCRLNRFDVDCIALCTYSKKQSIDYYEHFYIEGMTEGGGEDLAEFDFAINPIPQA